MYLILTPEKRIVEICEHPSYVRRLSNGVVVLRPKEEADAIYSNDTDSFYPLAPFGYVSEGHTLVEVDAVPPEVVAGFYFYHAGEFYTTEANLTALAKSKAPEVAGLVFVKMAEEGTLDDVTVTEHIEQFPTWSAGIAYAVKALAKFENKLYRCIQAHTSQEDWTPPATPTLWKEVGDPAEEWPEWSQPIGATDAYQTGDKVSYEGKHWISTCDNNVWAPGVYGWEEA